MQFPRERRLTESGEFRQVRAAGRSKAGKSLVVGISTENGESPARFGIITTKKIGNAVTRNRARRRIRAVIQDAGDHIPPGTRVVTIARHKAATIPFGKLRSEWLWLTRKLLNSTGSPR